MYRRRIRWVSQRLYGYLIGMGVEIAATVALMGVGLVISMLGFYLLK